MKHTAEMKEIGSQIFIGFHIIVMDHIIVMATISPTVWEVAERKQIVEVNFVMVNGEN